MSGIPKRLSADERRLATVEAVVELAAKKSPSEITTTTIATHMGLTQGALFRHFPTKMAILESVMDSVSRRLLSRVDKAIHGTSSPLEALEAVFIAHIDFISAHPGIPKIVFAELQSSDDTLPKRIVRGLLQRYRLKVEKLLQQAREKEELHSCVDISAASVLFIGTIQGLVMQSLLAGDFDQMRVNAPRVFSIYRRGIAAFD